MDRREWVSKAFNGERVDKVPVGFWFHFLDNEVISSGMEDTSLIQKNLEGHKKYNEELTDITWENCTLRYWLNNSFYNTAFSSSDKKTSFDISPLSISAGSFFSSAK